MDLICLIANKYSKSEIVEINQEIDSWYDIQEYVIEYRTRIDLDFQVKSTKASWVNPSNETELEKSWQNQEGEAEKVITVPWGINRISNFYSDLTFNRKTICICPSPEHKYANLHDPLTAKYIITLVRMIANRFGQNEIIYCVDSMYPPSLLYEEASSGKSLEDLKKIGINEFGEPKNDISDSMKDLFFFDKAETELPTFKSWNWSDSKYK